MSWNTHFELRAGAWGMEGKKELCFISLFFSRACYLSEKPPPGGCLIVFGEYTVGPPGVRSGSCRCAAASSCLSGRKREKGRKQGEEERKTCTMFDQWGTESPQDGSRDQGFATKLREERLNETFEKWSLRLSDFKVSLREHVRIESWSTAKCLFPLIPGTARGLFWREICEAEETKKEKENEKKKKTVMFYHLRCGAVNMRVLQLTAITPPGLANATPWKLLLYTFNNAEPPLITLWRGVHYCVTCAPLEIRFINNFTSPLHVSCRKW